MDKGGAVGPKLGIIAQDQNIKGLQCCSKAFELYLEGNRDPLENLSTGVTQSYFSVSLMCQ